VWRITMSRKKDRQRKPGKAIDPRALEKVSGGFSASYSVDDSKRAQFGAGGADAAYDNVELLSVDGAGEELLAEAGAFPADLELSIEPQVFHAEAVSNELVADLELSIEPQVFHAEAVSNELLVESSALLSDAGFVAEPAVYYGNDGPETASDGEEEDLFSEFLTGAVEGGFRKG